MNNWGLLPKQIIQLIRQREWENMTSLKSRLLGEKPFPLRIKLKVPNGQTALTDIAHFQNFINEWKAFPYQEMLEWQTKNFRNFSTQLIPTSLVINSIKQLIQLLGKDAKEQSELWERNMAPLLRLNLNQSNQNIYAALVTRLEEIEKLSESESQLLAKLISQLKPGLGNGRYLRALPLNGIDTKFLEQHQTLIATLTDVLHPGEVTTAGGLINWLKCQNNPKDWLIIRPLCQMTKQALGNIPILKMPTQVLKTYELPAKNILVVENVQSGLALPYLNDTIAVIGGGKNVAWMEAHWLSHKRTGYWGDIDTWGLHILSNARDKCAHIEALLMDRATLKVHETHMISEPKPLLVIPPSLHAEEKQLFNDLITGKFQSTRLEQERISSDYMRKNLQDWSIREG